MLQEIPHLRHQPVATYDLLTPSVIGVEGDQVASRRSNHVGGGNVKRQERIVPGELPNRPSSSAVPTAPHDVDWP